MIYLCLVIMILGNAFETISYSNTKVKNTIGVLFGVSLWSTIFAVVACIIFYLAIGDSVFAGLNAPNILIIMVMALLNIWQIVCWICATRKIAMSIAEGFSNIYIALLTLMSYVIFGGVLNWWDIVLMLIVVVACISLAFTTKTNNHSSIIGYLFLTLWIILACIRGLIPGEVASASMHGSTFSLILNLTMLLPSSAILICNHKMSLVTQQVLTDPYLVILGLVRVASQIAIIHLAIVMNLGLIDAIAVLGLVIIMLFERVIMKQKLNKWSYPLLVIIMIATFMLMIV